MGPSTQPSNFEGGIDFDWRNYLTHRPQYSASFYDVVWGYHGNHSDQWSLAHDVGTGPGSVAKVLAHRFTMVVATDPSGYHVAVARKFSEEGNITIEPCRAEDLASTVGRDHQGKVDLITIAQAVPLLDAQQAFSQCADLSSPGGTLAVWFHWGPIFVEEGQQVSHKIHDGLTGKTYVERTLPWGGSMIRRLERQYLDFEPDYKFAVTSEEKVDERIERSVWLQDGRDINWVRGFGEAQWPSEKALSKEFGEELERMFKQLEATMGGKTGRLKIGWPVALLLATRK